MEGAAVSPQQGHLLYQAIQRRTFRWTLALVVVALTLLLVFPIDPSHLEAGGLTEEPQQQNGVGPPKVEASPNPDAVPEQVHISLGRNETEIIVMWVTKVKLSSVVRYGLHSGGYTHSALTEANGTTAYTFSSYTSGSFHTVVLTGLKPATTYYYQCGTAAAWSSEFSFTTAPRVGTHGVVVGTVGDMGTAPASQRLVDVMGGKGLQMFWHVGDLSYADGWQPKWDIFGRMLQPIGANMPYMPLAGNHENNNPEHSFLPFSLRYNMPLIVSYTGGEDFYYSFNFGSIHFVCLDSEHGYGVDSPQYRWLQADLQAVDRHLTPWLVVGWHRPWYNSNWAHQNEIGPMQDAMEDLLYQHKVDLCVSGHVHAYERTHPVFKEAITPDAPVYITIGTGGTPEGLINSWMGKPSWSAVQNAQDWGFGRLHAFNATHARWDFFHNDNNLADTFTLVRQRSSPQ